MPAPPIADLALYRVAKRIEASVEATNQQFDLLVVGAGLTGATIARLAADAGFRVLVLERREAVGGNIRDAVHESGIRYGLYGPHYFRTSSRRIWDWVNRFATFRPFAAEVKTSVSGRLEDWPLTSDYLERTFGPKWVQMVPIYWRNDLKSFEDVCLATMPRAAYDGFVRDYTAKQWGTDPRELEPGLSRRFGIRSGPDRRLKTSKWQGVPENGYTALVERMLANSGPGAIEVRCETDYLRLNMHVPSSPLTVFTGPIDEFFWFDLGRLRYRAQQRELSWSPGPLIYPVVQVNTPAAAVPWVRVIEWRHMMPEVGNGTLLTTEYPIWAKSGEECEYPFPSAADRALYQRYRKRAAAFASVIFAGRLGEYRYLDMDQAIARAMKLFASKIAPRLEKEETG
jgi:UDP-galactopyranose mutase